MKKSISCRLHNYLFSAVAAFSAHILFPAAVLAQHGHEKTIVDNTYGPGGSKSMFSAKDHELIIYRDPNQVRRLLQTTVLAKEGDDSVRLIAKMYYDNKGKKDYFNKVTIDKNNRELREIRADFSNDKLLSGSAWELQGSVKLSYALDLASLLYARMDKSPEPTDYKPDMTLGNIKATKAPKLKFIYLLSGKDHYIASEKTDEYTGGRVTTEAYKDYDGYYDESYNVEDRKLYDKNGTLRHEIYREYYSDDCVYEEETYYDCHGTRIYYSEEWYDDFDGYSYELYESFYKEGRRTAGYYYYDDYYDGYREYYDPASGEWVEKWSPDLNKPSDFHPDFADCPDECRYWYHDFFGGFSIIREDDGSDGFYLYGLLAAYTYNISKRVGITADAGLDFRKENDTKITKLILLAGATYWAKEPCFSNPWSFSLHALAGISNIHYNYSSQFGSFKSSDSYFTLGLGGSIGYYFTPKWGLGLRLDALPTFARNNTSFNLRAGLGLIHRVE